MVDISSKSVTHRVAVARSTVWLPASVASLLAADGRELISAKGPVLMTALIAGTQAVKRTSDLIPFCHPLMLTNCRFAYDLLPLPSPSTPSTDTTTTTTTTTATTTTSTANSERKGGLLVVIDCRVEVEGKTGVEMEALTGVSVAALTVYDMLKAVSHDIVIEHTQLLYKTGGKSDLNKSPL